MIGRINVVVVVGIGSVVVVGMGSVVVASVVSVIVGMRGQEWQYFDRAGCGWLVTTTTDGSPPLPRQPIPNGPTGMIASSKGAVVAARRWSFQFIPMRPELKD